MRKKKQCSEKKRKGIPTSGLITQTRRTTLKVGKRTRSDGSNQGSALPINHHEGGGLERNQRRREEEDLIKTFQDLGIPRSEVKATIETNVQTRTSKKKSKDDQL